jgi:hypothetical protein
MAYRRPLQTQFALQATGLADSFRTTVGQLRLGPHGYVPDMTSPEGPSTGGGVQAMQHLRLVAPQAALPTLVVGHANMREGTAELRTWEHVDAICRERSGHGVPFDPSQYQEFLQSAQGFLAACGLRVVLSPTPAQLLARGLAGEDAVAPVHPPRLTVVLVATVTVFAAAAAVIVWKLVLTQ